MQQTTKAFGSKPIRLATQSILETCDRFGHTPHTHKNSFGLLSTFSPQNQNNNNHTTGWWLLDAKYQIQKTTTIHFQLDTYIRGTQKVTILFAQKLTATKKLST
jgi:hypothetical protein